MRITESKLRRIIRQVIQESKLSRRDALKNLGLGALATFIAGCEPKKMVTMEEIIEKQMEGYRKACRKTREAEVAVKEIEKQIRDNDDDSKVRVLERLLDQAKQNLESAKYDEKTYKEMVLDRR